MSTSFLGLRTVVYMVTDLPAAIGWYKNILGIEPYFNTEYYVGFSVGGYELGLHPAAADNVQGTNIHTYWGVEDVHQKLEQLLAAGATECEQPNDVGGGIVLASVKDPWGNVFGIIYNPHFALNN